MDSSNAHKTTVSSREYSGFVYYITCVEQHSKLAMAVSPVAENKVLKKTVSYDCHGFAMSEEETQNTESQE